MYSVLIVDAHKPSLVMTSEIIKDSIQGVSMEVLGSGQECLECTRSKIFDLIVIDFDLPDSDGVTLSKLLRSYYEGPILITAFDDEVVQEAIKTEMFAYSDICSYVKKPIVAKDFIQKLQKFLIRKESVQKTFATSIPLELSKITSSKTKQAKEVRGKLMNLRLSGAEISTLQPIEAKIGEELSLTLNLPKKLMECSQKSEKSSIKFKANLVWMDKTKKKAKFEFRELNEKMLKDLEMLMRASEEA